MLLGNWSEGTALPLLGSLPRTPQVWQEVGSLQPCGQVWGCQMLQAGGWPFVVSRGLDFANSIYGI